MRKALFIMLSGIFCALTQPMSAQIIAPDSLVSDTLVLTSDTLELTEDSIIGLDPDPEWYVAPDVLDDSVSLRAPMRAAASCPVDSICTFNIDSVLTEVTVYEYGDTTRTMVWTVNANGSRVGKSRTEEASTSTSSYSATYAWDNTANNWKGTTKTEKTFASGKETVRIIYNTWLNNNWVADTKYTWVYDASGREIEYTTYTRNTSTNQLVLSKQRTREYNAANKITLEIQYTAHNGTTWSAGTKKVYAFDASGYQIEYTYYSSLSNGNWVGSTHEVWEYTSGKKTYYEKQTWSSGNWVNSAKEIWAYNGPSAKQTLYEKHTWSNGAWVGSSKEIWEYNGPSSKQTLHEKYGWANGNWSISLQENLGYDDAGNNNLVLNYTITSGTWKGSKKEEYTYNAAKKKTQTIKYKWSNNDWVYNTRLDNDYDAAGNTTETANYLWSNGAWKGTGTRTLTTFNSNKKETEKITQTWPTDATDWVNATRKTTEYEGTRTTQEASYTWSTDLNAWVGTSRSDWHYNAAGQNDTIKTYTPNGTEWIFSSRTVKTYDAKGNNTLTHNAQWNTTESKWQMTSMSKLEIAYDASNRQILNATWQCSFDSIWIGVQKDTASYTASGKSIYTARYTSWANGDWVPSYYAKYEYDDAERTLLYTRMDWVNGKWKGNFKYDYEYNAQGAEIMSAYYGSWNTTTDTWVGTSKKETVYNSAGLVESTTNYDWKNNDWSATNKYLYYYNANNQTIERVVQNYTNGAWVNSLRYETLTQGTTVKSNDYKWLNNNWQYSRRSEKTYDNDAAAKLRREITGSWNNNGVLTSFTDKHYYYACDPRFYIIRFVNYNGTELSSETVEEGTTPTYKGENPTREATPEYTYTFEGWTPAIAPATTNITYTATYTATKRSYTITWLNEDGSQIDQTTVKYGETPAHADMSKENTAEYTYEFIGWTPGIGVVTGDATYKATFSETKNKYTITWLNDNDTQIDQTTVEYGVMPTHADATKTNTAEWTYTFKGWNPEIIAVNSNATYKATYTATKNKYTVVFQDEGGAELQSGEVEYGTMPEFTGAQPSKEATVQYTYSFNGWDPEITAVEGAQTYTAKYSSTVNKYTIKWLNDDDTELQIGEVEYGTTPTYDGETPHKEADAQYTYTFAGWDKEVVSVTGEATYKATYSSTTNQYTVKFVNYNGDELQSSSWNYGASPSYSGETPTKPADDENHYAFAGWSPVVSVVTKDATYTATYTEAVNEYTITWFNDDNTLIDQTTVAYGVVPTHEDPTKENTAEWTYTFAGWDHDPVAVTGNASYKATYTKTKNKYTITWLNEDGSELSHETLEYGVTPEHEDLTKENTAEWTYMFTGWTPDIASVTGNAEYTATFSATKNKYTITFLNYDGTELQSGEVEYGVKPTYEGADPTKPADAQDTYTFAGWDKEIVEVDGTATYTATFSNTTNQYTITWLNDDNSQIDQTTVAYGETPTHADAEKSNTAEWTYTFSGWDPEVVSVTGNATYKATFNATKNSYAITWKNEDGSVIESETLEYGVTPEHAALQKDNTAEWTYTFSGWTPDIASVTGNAEYTATFSATKNKYTITFLNYDGTELQSGEVEYGVKPTYEGADPTKPADAQDTYTFAGWDKEIVEVVGEETYTATFSTTTNEYTITWFNDDNTLIDQTTVAYGVVPTHEDPTKENTAEWTYTFAGWDHEPVAVTGAASYTAVFTATKNSYTITWLNEDGDEIEHETLEYGKTPEHTAPVKENTAEWTYTFTGWTPAIESVKGDASYKATFSATKNSYTIKFLNYNGEVLQSTNVEYGVKPVYEGTIPAKPEDDEFHYAFAGWDKEIVEVAGEETYTATFSTTTNEYTISWFNDDNTLIDQTTVAYGVVPTHADPTKENTAEFTYTFSGWDHDPVAVTGAASYKATYTKTKNKYTITWLNEDGSEIEHETLEYGATPSHADIYKESTEEFTYTFIGWTPSIVPVNGDAAYKAVFEATPVEPSSKTFTITFLHDDGITILEQVIVEYGEIPVCRYTPTKMGDAEHYYTFVGWSPEIVPATCNASYTPLFELKARQYVITFKNYDGKVLQTAKVDYGAIPEYTGATPTRNGTTQYAYVFTGWTPELAPVTKEATYKATFERTARIYTVIYYDEDGETELDRVEVPYGQMPHTSVVPTKEEDEEYYYVFIGWTPYVSVVTKDASYSALYQRKSKLEGIEDVESEEQAVKIFKNNILYILRAGKIYTADGKLVEGF